MSTPIGYVEAYDLERFQREGRPGDYLRLYAQPSDRAKLPLYTQTPAPASRSGDAGGELPPLPEPLEIDWPELHSHALGCGVEDRGIRDRYEAAEYGWQDGVDKATERVPEVIFDADQMREYGRACYAAGRATHAPEAKAEPATSGATSAAKVEVKPVGMVAKATFGAHRILVPFGPLEHLPLGTKVYVEPTAGTSS